MLEMIGTLRYKKFVYQVSRSDLPNFHENPVTWPCGIPSGRKKPNWRFFALLKDGWNTEKYADIDWWVQKANLWETEISGEDASLKEFSTWQKSVLDKNLFAHVALWLGYIVIKYSL